MEKIINNFRIMVVKDYDAMSDAAAHIVTRQIAAKPDSVLGLATGSTPIGTYARLIQAYKAGSIDFSKITTFNLDEYYPISPDNNQSYTYYMNNQLFRHININVTNVNIPSGTTGDAAAECAAYEAKLAASGGIDLQLLGLGHNGHIGFNEPSNHFPAATHHTALDASTIAANARFFDNPDDVPKHALTMGIGTIFGAKHILMLISGADKAKIAYSVLRGTITPQVPASVLQLHSNCTIILDEAAATELNLQ